MRSEDMRRYFRPQKDITAYEAAYILGHITRTESMWEVGVLFTDDQWSNLAEEMKRHFSETK